MITNESFIELNNNFYTSCKAKARIFTLLTVPTLVLIFVFLGYFNYVPLKVELHSVVLISIVYFIYLFFVPHNAYFVSCKFKSQYKLFIGHFTSYINNNTLVIGGVSKANGSAGDFLKDFTSNIRNTNFSSVASGVFPTLGILGTFISIAFSMPDFASGDSTTLEKEISILLSGVGTAFYISIYGIFLSLWWTFFEKIGMSRFEHDVFIIKEHTKHFFWTKLDIESIHIKNSLENYDKMTHIFEQITSVDLLNNIQNSIEQRAGLLENILDKEVELSQNIENNIQSSKNLSSMIENMHLNTSNNSKNLQKQEQVFINTSNTLNENVEKLTKSMENIQGENLEKVYTNIIKSVETMKYDMNQIERRFNQELDEYDEKFTGRLRTSLEEIDTQTVKIIEDLQAFKDLSK